MCSDELHLASLRVPSQEMVRYVSLMDLVHDREEVRQYLRLFKHKLLVF